MICHTTTKNKTDKKSYLLVGSTNVGKSTFYNKITWKYSSVANADKITTTSTWGKLRADKNVIVVDLPGINTLNATAGYDEEISLSYILNNKYQGCMNILSATSLKRDFHLTYDLAEAGILTSMIVNMVDELNGAEIKTFQLVKEFKVPVSLISAKKNSGLSVALTNTLNHKLNPKPFAIKYASKIEKFITAALNKISDHNNVSKRFILIQFLLKNKLICEYLTNKNEIEALNKIKKELKISANDISDIKQVKKLLVDKLFNKCFITLNKDDRNKTASTKKEIFYEKIDRILLSPYISIPFFILLTFGIYYLTFGPYAGGFIQEQLAGGFESLQIIIADSIKHSWWGAFVADGIFGGIFTILSFLPWIIILTLITSFIDQIGLLARMSISFDKLFEKFGVSGRSVVNLIAGIGCNIPSILLARNASSKKERIISVLIAPLVSCSARIIVYGFVIKSLLAGTPSADLSWLFIGLITAFSVIVTLFAGLTFSKILFRNTNTIFIGHVSKWRSVDWFVLAKKTIMESYQFVKKTIIIVAIANLVVWILTYLGPSGNPMLDETQINQSFLYYLSLPFKYILYPTGLGFDWRFPVSIISSFPAKEVASSTISTLFGTEVGFANVVWNLKLPIATIASYLMYFTFFIPCMATVVVIKKEIGKKYLLIHIVFSLLLAYVSSWIIFILIGSFEGYVNQTVIYNLPILLLSVFGFISISLIGIIYIIRSFLQSKGHIEKITYKKYFQITNYSLLTCSVVMWLSSNVMLLI